MTPQPTETQQWLSLKEASEQLSVHATTLRRWADKGDIPVMLTPGGHRRFSSVDLDQFVHNRHGMRNHRKVEQAWANRAVAAARKEATHPHNMPWMAALDEPNRQRGRLLGQQLMALTLQFIAGDEDAHILTEARRLGEAYGQLCRQMEMPLTAALQISMSFRDSMIEAALTLPENMNIRPEANVRLLRRINTLLNSVHLAVATIYDGSKNDTLPGA